MRSFTTVLLATLATLLLPFAAAAEDAAEDPPRDRLETRFGVGYFNGSFPTLTVRRADLGAGILYRPDGLPIALGAGVRVGAAFLEIDGPLAENLGMRATLSHLTNLSLDADVVITVYDRPKLKVDLYSGIEMSPFDDRLRVDHGSIIVDQGSFDISPFLRDHLVMRYGWNRMDAGVIARLRLGDFEPRLGVGFERLVLRVTAELDDDGKFVLSNLSADSASVERLYEDDITAISIAPGLRWRMSERFGLDVSTFVLPTAEAFFCGGTTNLLLFF
jgi:hypothetical protein